MPDPIYLTLDEWGGTPNGWSYMSIPASDLWVHHSVTNEDIGVNPTEDAIADFRELDAIGRSRGHGGISYSYAIHPQGVIGEGQGLRRGAHTAGNGCNHSPWGWNPCSFGVVFIGNFEEDELTLAAIASFRWLRDVLVYTGALEPGIYPTGGHGDAPGNSTACPGRNVEAALDALRVPYHQPEDDEMNPDQDTRLRDIEKKVNELNHQYVAAKEQGTVAVINRTASDVAELKTAVAGLVAKLG